MPAGRPSSYKPEYVEQARKLCQLGATDMELADFFEVNVLTIYRWRIAHPEFCNAMDLGKEAPNTRVKRSLYNRAVGYSYASEKVFQYQGEIVRAETIEHVPPDANAAFLWLKNREPDEWRDKQQVEHSGAVSFTNAVTASYSTDEDK